MRTLRLTVSLSLHFAAFSISAYTQICPGCLDATFGLDGFVKTSLNFNTGTGWANAIAVQADDKILVAADSANYENTATKDFYILRYDANGSLDTSFGNGGIVRLAFTSAADREVPFAITVQPDGKILVGGYVSTNSVAAIARLDESGQLDPTFDGDGKATFVYANKEAANITKILVQENAKIVLGGTSGGKVGLARLNANGTFDTTFNGSGKVAVSVSPQKNSQNGGLSDLTIQPDGKYLASGLSGSGPRQPQSWMLMRVNPNGTLDSGFGSGGKVINNLGGTWSVARNVHVYPDGKILASGDMLVSPYSTYIYARYLPNGQLDSSFGSGGRIMMAAGGSSRIESLHVQTDGKIVGSGWWRDVNNTNTNVLIMRLNPDGSMDPGFGVNGFTFTDYNGLGDTGDHLAVQSDGKYVLAGVIDGYGSTNVAIGLYRYLP